MTSQLHMQDATSDQYENFWGSSRDKMDHRKKIHDDIGHVIRQPYYFFPKKTFKNVLFWSGSTDRGETLHVWPPIHEEQKSHTYNVIGHMVWQSYWIYPKTYKKNLLLQNAWTNRGGTSHKCSPSHGCTILLRNNWEVIWFGSHIGLNKNIK